MYRKLFSLSSDKQKKWCLFFLFVIMTYSVLESLLLLLILPYIQFLQFYAGIEDNSGFVSKIFDFINYEGSLKNKLIFFSFFILALVILKTLLQTYMLFLESIIPFNIFRELSHELNQKYIYMPWREHIGRNSNELIKNVIRTTEYTAYSYLLSLQILSSIIVTFCILIVLFVINLKVSLGIILLFSIIGIVIYIPLKNTLSLAGESKEKSLEMINKVASEIYLGNREIKVFEKEHKFISDFYYYLTRLKDAFWKLAFYPRISPPIMEAVAITLLTMSVLLCLLFKIELSIFIGYLIFYGVAGRRLLPSLVLLISNIMNIKGQEASINIIYNEIKNNNKFTEILADENFPFEKQFSMEKISFSYEKNLVLNNLSLVFKKNNKTAIVGMSGSGKSTVLNILLGLIEPNKGKFFIDGKEKNSFRGLRKQIGFVPQRVILLDDTIGQNIAFGELEIDEKLVHEVIEFAGLKDFLLECDKGINTIIGEQGERLSGGQLQRLGIARALYRKPDILIFDEATSSLDYITESILNETIKKLAKTKTIITITHRISSVEEYDKIYVLNKGFLESHGTHENLLSESKIYKKMNNLK